MKKTLLTMLLALAFFGLAGDLFAQQAGGATLPMGISVRFDDAEEPQDVSKSLKIFILMTVLSLAPSAIIMCTSFTRILIVFSLLKRALGTQQTPPGQVIASMALFLTIFIMMPVFQKINTDAVKPYMAEEISQDVAWARGIEPIRQFMSAQTGESELVLFLELAQKESAESIDDVPTEVLIPAFMLSELKTAFQMGFLIYLPFLVIDLVIASSLMSMGMMMLPPMMISLPIKILFFVLADGWTLMVRGVVTSFTL